MEKWVEDDILNFLRTYRRKKRFTLTDAAEYLGTTRYKIQKVAHKHNIELKFSDMSASAIKVTSRSGIREENQQSDSASLSLLQQSLIRSNLHLDLGRLAQLVDCKEWDIKNYVTKSGLQLGVSLTSGGLDAMHAAHKKWLSTLSLEDRVEAQMGVKIKKSKRSVAEKGTKYKKALLVLPEEQKQYIRDNLDLSYMVLSKVTGLSEPGIRYFLKSEGLVKQRKKSFASINWNTQIQERSTQRTNHARLEESSPAVSDRKGRGKKQVGSSANIDPWTKPKNQIVKKESASMIKRTSAGPETKGTGRRMDDATKEYIRQNHTKMSYEELSTATTFMIPSIIKFLKKEGLYAPRPRGRRKGTVVKPRTGSKTGSKKGSGSVGRGAVAVPKPFQMALCTGRYQNFTRSHADNLLLASKMAETVVVVIGSAQESGTERNPLPIALRRQIIEAFLSSSVVAACNFVVIELADLSNETDIRPEWGTYLFDAVRKETGRKPDLIIHGDDGRANDPILWFSEEEKVGVHFMMIPRNNDSLSGTKSRRLIVEERVEEWQESVPECTWSFYDQYREYLLRCAFYQNMIKEG